VKSERVVALKTNANCVWVAVLDPASGLRGRYTVYRIYRWADKRADIVGRELDLRTARKIIGGERDLRAVDKFVGTQRPGPTTAPHTSFDHECDWRKAAVMLAKCVVATLQTDGKIGMGSGMVMKVVDGKRSLERWDKDFVEALAYIGIEVMDGQKKKPKRLTPRSNRGAKV